VRNIIAPVVVTTVWFTASPALAHHSRAEFASGSEVVLQGTVTRFNWTNPHVYIYVVAEEAGKRVEWEVVADAVPILARSGWTARSLAPGDFIRVRAIPNRSRQNRRVLLVSVTTAAGVTLAPRRSADERRPVAKATDLSGTWELPGGDDTGDFSKRWAAVPLTPKAAAAQAQFRPEDRPAAKCVAPPTPMIMAMPYLNEVDVRKDVVILRNEFFNVERTVYMDGRGHPANGRRTNQGHSIGRWEGGVLVVDTTLFEDHRAPIRAGHEGVPSGAQRHVVERYRLSEDRTRLLIDFLVEDPEYLVKPFSGTLEWVYSPHFKMMPFPCRP
jgi:hypothetical protein